MAYIENVELKQDDFVLEIPRWDFSDQDISSVWGESGSGKTTLLWLIAGLFDCKNFKLCINNEDLAKKAAQDRQIGFVFQDHGLFPHLTAQENILFPAQARRQMTSEIHQRFENLVKRLQLENQLNKKAEILSGGEAQRVAIARALLLKPKLILFDEPFSQLDSRNKKQAKELLRDLNHEFRTPFIIVTHDLEDVKYLAKQMLVLSNGKLVTQGPVGEVIQSMGLD
jgi:molybdate transport system ATP-binding protein